MRKDDHSLNYREMLLFGCLILFCVSLALWMTSCNWIKEAEAEVGLEPDCAPEQAVEFLIKEETGVSIDLTP